ncbi:SDR family NAD(P)-dependent oxidoreductase [Pseudomonas sp. NFACC13-1]|uniref:SDR family NAD(P)-dependent oxidoreductase n=1 Tax=Pseudomonas sp. NFACC13-1 TaxID=1566245 RepID=UPI000892339F|nr:glucose 1-dehydrogenase [Pseudomonas sp. NFACC13-1]SDB34967.1 NAD(P)-dependent dehydrogenase, short-chain alcohol dehydrogenase family [Pseudomonas sp. NFACC13-1]
MNGVFDISGKRALVTGASSGLGEHFAQTLARAGAHVLVAARRVERLQSLVERIRENGGSAQALALDVCCADSVARAVQIASEPGLDIVVNNAGVSVARPVLEQTEEDWDVVLETNLKGSWRVASESARWMVKQGRPGSIVNIASILGERVAGGVVPYAVSKAGVLHMTRALALEFARYDIRVNALAPGYVSTELNADFLASESGKRLMSRIPQRRFADPQDLDGALLLLVSQAGRAITGTTLAVDGGHLISSL